jgi:hypothetical protein
MIEIRTRILWLVYERVPHPDAVSYPADEEDAALARDLLSRSRPERTRIGEQLASYLHEQSMRPVAERRMVPVRRESGIYRLVSWRFAKWLSKALVAQDEAVSRTLARIERWQTSGRDGELVRGHR